MSPEDLARIHAAAFTDQRPWSAAEFADLTDSAHVFLAACPQAFALGRCIAGETELLTLATLPEARGQGLGRKMLRCYHDAALQRRGESSFLEVAETNHIAIRLYESEGYTQTAKRPNYYRLTTGQRVGALIFSRPLNRQ